MQPAVLYQFSLCPFCNKVRAGLELKGIPYSTVEVNPRTKVELPLLPGGAPRKVPVLEVGDVAVYDSTRILKFLDEAYPDTPRFDPEDDTDRKRSDTIEEWVDEEFIRALPTVIYGTWGEARRAARIIARTSNFGPLQGLGMKFGGAFVMHMVAKRILKKSDRTDPRTWVSECLDQFAEWLGDKPYVCGDTMTLADVAMAGAITCVQEFPIHEEITRNPRIAIWFQGMQKRVRAAAHPGE